MGLVRAQAGAVLSRRLSPADVAVLLTRHGLAPRKAAGQNFVGDPNTVAAIIKDAGLEPTDTVLEIGPGLGSLTLGLSDAVAKVVAVEIDHGLVRALVDVLSEVDNVQVHQADAMQADLGALSGGPYRCVANLPYNVATPLVLRALEDPMAVDAYVMVQKEVGQRWAAKPGDALYAGVSVKLQLLADVRMGRNISRHVFTPMPRVDSVMVRLVKHGDLDPWVRSVIDAAFARRRRTLRNTLQAVADVDRVEATLASLDMTNTTRPEELTPQRFVDLAEALRV
ncbi:MAG: 16S rRNA (adenine1518-N6/adenine1519-N6)-dimethyltransferase [Nitriliruptoraceae bacterium]|jgi:16S rRNA (adenine1518-N6/adenine1519-N6)-dimethyltransferase